MEKKHNKTNEEVQTLILSVYKKCYDCIFNNCKYVPNEVGFKKPSAITKPLILTEDEASIIVSHKKIVRRQYPEDVAAATGKKYYKVVLDVEQKGNSIHGTWRTFRTSKPRYHITFVTADGKKQERVLIPRDNRRAAENNRNLNDKIMYVVNGNDYEVKVTGKKFIMQINNGIITPC